MANYPDSTPSRPYNSQWGKPVICYLNPAMIGKPGYQMAGPPEEGGTYYRYPGVASSLHWRHFTLPEGVTLNSMLEPQLGNRRFRVTIPWNDVTWPAYYNTAGGSAIEGDTMGGDY